MYDLEETELCYAPPYGSARDAISFAGMIAADVLWADMPLTHWGDSDEAFLLDVREQAELAVEGVPVCGQHSGQARARLDEHPRARAIHAVCRSGQRAHSAARYLIQHGYSANAVSGGMLSRAILTT